MKEPVFTHEEFELFDQEYNDIMGQISDPFTEKLLKQCYSYIKQHSQKKLGDKYKMTLTLNDDGGSTTIETDLPIALIVNKLIEQNIEIVNGAYYDVLDNYASVDFLSIEFCLEFLDKVAKYRDDMFKRIECSENNKVKNIWKFELVPIETNNDQSITGQNFIQLTMRILIPEIDIPVVYDRLGDTSHNIKVFKTIVENDFDIDYDKIEDVRKSISTMIGEPTSPLTQKILKCFNDYLDQCTQLVEEDERIIYCFKKNKLNINKKLIPLIKEMLIAEMDINDHGCVYNDINTGYACLSFSCYAHATDFLTIITLDYVNDEIYKRILGNSSANNWKYGVVVIDINNDKHNKSKSPNFLPCVEIFVPHNDIKILIDRMKEYNAIITTFTQK